MSGNNKVNVFLVEQVKNRSSVFLTGEHTIGAARKSSHISILGG